jgi:hypothetical protein
MEQVVRKNGGQVSQRDEMVEIPESAVVACPLVGFDLAPVSRCVDCKVFAGLEDRFPGGTMPFHRRYLLKCLGEPVRRQMQVVVKG